ncbi:MAG: division/cell wall cluster transcriptional repressor MraZ [Chloroflexi bacterium]|nr:division/cell wall cluster transcriptional repressor MraZ [Chloroflexota bacterium]MBU1751615.1 division/cell wall cluster transcriptional repressor MraZ [Chloroflexota bacterium]
MFLGEFEHTLDSKGRLSIPARFRADLEAGLVVTRGLGDYLMAFPPAEWERFIGDMRQREMTLAESQTISRFIFARAAECTLDGHGRTLIPAPLRQYAHLDTDVTVVGMDTHLEIWDRARWAEEQDRVEREGLQVATEQFRGLWL